MNSRKILWLETPKDGNYPAALSYLSLIFERATADLLVHKLLCAKISNFKAKDIFRASGLSLLGISNSHIVANNKKINKGEALSPILLVRDRQNGKVIVADGYHRLCSVYHYHEDADVPCKIVTL